MKRKQVFLLIVILAVLLTSCTSQNGIDSISKNMKINKYEHINRQRNDSDYSNAQSAGSVKSSQEALSEELTDASIFYVLLAFVKNMFTMFAEIALILSCYLFLMYIREWIIIVSQIKRNFFMMHYLQLIDGKKYA